MGKSYNSAYARLTHTQCDWGTTECFHFAGEACKYGPTEDCVKEYTEVNDNCQDLCVGPLRQSRDSSVDFFNREKPWEPIGEITSETDANLEAGYCGMPLTHFNDSAGIPMLHGFPMFKAIHYNGKGAFARTGHFMHEHNKGGYAPNKMEYTEWQKCKEGLEFSIPYEMTKIADVPLPSSSALDSFLDHAWEGLGTIGGVWDACNNICDIQTEKNKMCGGDGLSDFIAFPKGEDRRLQMKADDM